MRRLIDNIYFRDLMCRQNKDITKAQIHNYIHAKRYSNKEIGECFKEVDHSALKGYELAKLRIRDVRVD